MTDNSVHPPGAGPAGPPAAAAPQRRSALLAAVAIIAGSAILGFAAGALWSAVAPRVVYQVVTLKPPTAYAVNPETSAFIAADGWYCFIALAGGALIGLLSYLFAVRRHGPAPMAAVVIGSTGAAFLAEWAGHLLSGGANFDQVLATSKVGELLHAPVSLGSHGALAFWPLAAGLVAGAFELVAVLRVRQRAGDRGMLAGFHGIPGLAAPGQPRAGDPPTPPGPRPDPGPAPGDCPGQPDGQ